MGEKAIGAGDYKIKGGYNKTLGGKNKIWQNKYLKDIKTADLNRAETKF